MHVKQFKLMDLLEEVTAGNIVIPDFQRDFVWERNQIEELLSSVLNGYFVGTILLLESPAATPRFAPRHVFGAPKASPRGETFKYILDGQQRITSLYYAFYEPELELPDDVSATRFFLRLPQCQEIIGVQSVDHLFRRFFPEPDAKKLLKAYADVLSKTVGIDIDKYPTMKVFRAEDLLMQYLQLNSTLASEVQNRLRDVLKAIWNYEVAVVTLRAETPDDEIVNTFERINRTGTRLDIFDLAVARYYPIGIRLNKLKEELEASKGAGAEMINLLGPESTLKSMALLKGLDPKNKSLLRLVSTNAADKSRAQAEFYTLWETVVKYLTKAVERARTVYGAIKLKVGKRQLDLMPYTTMPIPLAAMLREVETRGGQKTLYEKVALWYWTTVFTQRYTHAVDTQSFGDVAAVTKWLSDDNAKPEWTCDPEAVVTEMKKASRTSALAKAFYNFLVLNEPKDFFNAQHIKLEECQIDHVFPASKYPAAEKDIFNFSIIHKDTNRKKTDMLPSEFIARCLESHGGNAQALEATLATHFISTEAVRAMQENNLHAFLAARTKAFVNALRSRVLARPTSPQTA